MPGCPIRKSADQRPFAPPRGLSQLITSFVACESLGIRHTPFSTFARTELAFASSVDYTFSFLFTTSYYFVLHTSYIVLHKTWRFALHFAFAFNMSKNRGCISPSNRSNLNNPSIWSCSQKWKPEGLDLSAGPVPVFPIIYNVYRDKRIAAPQTGTLHANLAVPLTCVV